MQVRFLFPVLPLFNVAAAAGFVRLAQNRRKSRVWAAAHGAAVAAVAATAAAMSLMSAASRHNYPGGHALARLHALEAAAAQAALQQGAPALLVSSCLHDEICLCLHAASCAAQAESQKYLAQCRPQPDGAHRCCCRHDGRVQIWRGRAALGVLQGVLCLHQQQIGMPCAVSARCLAARRSDDMSGCMRSGDM
jgi:hypothetical protein